MASPTVVAPTLSFVVQIWSSTATVADPVSKHRVDEKIHLDEGRTVIPPGPILFCMVNPCGDSI
jgi:hypothetical protein